MVFVGTHPCGRCEWHLLCKPSPTGVGSYKQPVDLDFNRTSLKNQKDSMHNDLHALRRILKSCPTIAVVGLSAEWHRPSYFAAKYMQSHGFKIVPVNPRYAGGQVLGETCYASLSDIPFKVDMVDVFRRSEDVLPIAEQAVQIGAQCLWQQLGVANREADALARQAGMDSVTNRCVKIEHARLFGGLNWVGVNTGIISARRLV